MAKQQYKAIYFKDYPSNKTKDKSITLAFSEPETPYYSKVKKMTTQEIKELIGITTYKQLKLFSEKEERSINQVVKRLIKENLGKIDKIEGIEEKDVTFENSKEIPFQRWYPYIEGYSPDFITSLITEYQIKNKTIYDPFSGTGTTIFAADKFKLRTVFSEVNPLLQFLIQTKIEILNLSNSKRVSLSKKVHEIGNKVFTKLSSFKKDTTIENSYPILFGNSKYFPDETYCQILQLRSFIDIVKLEDELLAKVLSVGVFACLIPVSFLKKQGDVRFMTKKEIDKHGIKSMSEILPQKLFDIAEDIKNVDFKLNTKPEFLISNAKQIGSIRNLEIGAVITSPPYLNGTNYFRNTKLELWFLRLLQHKNDLRFFRDDALTSGINDVKKEYAKSNGIDIISKSQILKDTLLDLNKHAYDSRIPLMALSYFKEMYSVFCDLRKLLEDNSQVLMDIGDSIFAGVHIKTDEILAEILQELDYEFIDNKILRKRRSKNQQILTQSLLVFKFRKQKNKRKQESPKFKWKKNWSSFKTELPHQQGEYGKRNWGHTRHSICSYQGKLKPAIANHLVKTFVPQNGSLFDPFSGVGTIPFEAALNGKMSYGLDISTPAYYISSAKVSNPQQTETNDYIESMRQFISTKRCTKAELKEVKEFGFNKTIFDYFEPKTLKEIILARRFISLNKPQTGAEMLVVSSLLHILHGNRPYALSRRSHPIVPYAPTGEFEYKNLIEKLREKVDRSLNAQLPINFKSGKIFNQDITDVWPQEINNLDAIITSPPFFDSTRFYLANWMRIWFSGWSKKDFDHQINSFIDEKQKKGFEVYETIFRQSKERLKKDGVCVLHLGKSKKCDMAKELQKVSRRWFKKADLFDESVAHCESHGIRDKGTVTSHQYLVLV